MGHCFLEYKNKYIRLPDFNIWVFRHFMLKSTNDEDLKDFINNLEWLGPGVFSGTDLHNYTGSEKKKLYILTIALNRVILKIESFGDYIPLEYLEEYVNLKEAYFTRKQPTKQYIDDINAILRMIEEVENA